MTVSLAALESVASWGMNAFGFVAPVVMCNLITFRLPTQKRGNAIVAISEFLNEAAKPGVGLVKVFALLNLEGLGLVVAIEGSFQVSSSNTHQMHFGIASAPSQASQSSPPLRWLLT